MTAPGQGCVHPRAVVVELRKADLPSLREDLLPRTAVAPFEVRLYSFLPGLTPKNSLSSRTGCGREREHAAVPGGEPSLPQLGAYKVRCRRRPRNGTAAQEQSLAPSASLQTLICIDASIHGGLFFQIDRLSCHTATVRNSSATSGIYKRRISFATCRNLRSFK